jgi:hypothetical protein
MRLDADKNYFVYGHEREKKPVLVSNFDNVAQIVPEFIQINKFIQ